MITDKYKMYILVNKDIKMGKGKTAGQVAHAITVYMMGKNDRSCMLSEIIKRNIWFEKEQTKIILKAEQEVLENFEKMGYVAIRDKGYTQIEPNTLTTVLIGILNSEEVDKTYPILKELKLL